MDHVCLWCGRSFVPGLKKNHYRLESAGLSVCWDCSDKWEDTVVDLGFDQLVARLDESQCRVRTDNGHVLPLTLREWKHHRILPDRTSTVGFTEGASNATSTTLSPRATATAITTSPRMTTTTAGPAKEVLPARTEENVGTVPQEPKNVLSCPKSARPTEPQEMLTMSNSATSSTAAASPGTGDSLIDDSRLAIDKIDDEIIRLLWTRRLISREIQNYRVRCGESRTSLKRENVVIDHYASKLGPEGRRIADHILHFSKDVK
jgi:chorismate mutase